MCAGLLDEGLRVEVLQTFKLPDGAALGALPCFILPENLIMASLKFPGGAIFPAILCHSFCYRMKPPLGRDSSVHLPGYCYEIARECLVS